MSAVCAYSADFYCFSIVELSCDRLPGNRNTTESISVKTCKTPLVAICWNVVSVVLCNISVCVSKNDRPDT